ncbi:MAG TPA: ElyC/SanA/YdcF family protein [Syntrophales bacterium]|nr:ElyC/SanA/YdcF family protein [Syntrophales bacterium]HOL59673.1 ElyC/SanA/YdcF family protein [Syntrophales bacterium]HPO35819.1 ElyC/SanA/YdcF family protein [Syntrophales bacterium]
MSLFVLKKIVTHLLYPLSIVVILFFAGTVLSLRKRSRKQGKIILILGIITLILSSFEPITDRVVAILERKYPPLTEEAIKKLPPVKYICVLGGGTNPNPGRPFTSQLSRSSMVRLVEAVRIYRHLPGSKMILSGGAVFTDPPEAIVFSHVAQILSVPREAIIIEAQSRDTADQAKWVKSIVSDSPVIVVTSALHMPRSVALFEQLGLKVIPAPTDYRTTGKAANPIKRFFPSPDSLLNLESAVHELLGLAWIKISR